VLQTLKAALVFQIKAAIGVACISKREHAYTQRAIERWSTNDNIEILGPLDPERRVGILSFNIKDPNGRYLHHKFVTAILNDLFGIQSRAGCSCAGPYGHRLLGIDNATSERYRHAVQGGYCGLKPGWCRVGLHWVMDDAEADFVIAAIHFVARYGYRFLDHYDFDLATGTWSYQGIKHDLQRFSLQNALAAQPDQPSALPLAQRCQMYAHYLSEAENLAIQLDGPARQHDKTLDPALNDLQFFSLPGTSD